MAFSGINDYETNGSNNQLYIKKEKINDIHYFINDYLSKVINTRVWIDDKLSIEKDSISLLTVFLNPEDDDFIIYRILIGNEGKYSKRIRKIFVNH